MATNDKQQTTPVSTKNQKQTDEEISYKDEPIPKWPLTNQKHIFMSPTDSMTSPCTQKLNNMHRLPMRNSRTMPGSNLVGSSFNRPPSKLVSNKENEPTTNQTEKQILSSDTLITTTTVTPTEQ